MTAFPMIAADLYLRDRALIGPAGPEPALPDQAAAFAAEFAATLNRNEATARAAMTGDADLHSLIEALASTQNAVETVAALRDRVVEAYQEILRMPI